MNAALHQLGNPSIPLKEPFQNRVVHGNLVLSHWGTLLEMCDFVQLTFYRRGPGWLFMFSVGSPFLHMISDTTYRISMYRVFMFHAPPLGKGWRVRDEELRQV